MNAPDVAIIVMIMFLLWAVKDRRSLFVMIDLLVIYFPI